MVASKRSGSGEPSTSMPNAGEGLSSGPSRSGSKARDCTSSTRGSQAVGSKPRLGPQNGMVREEAKAFTSALTPMVNSEPANGGATSQTRIAACGTSNTARSPSVIAWGSPRASLTLARSQFQRWIFWVMAAFSLLLRTISMMRCSRPLILSRSISAWRSCRLTARWPCTLGRRTPASKSAWRSKNSGTWPR
ncbi:hypothetical protein D3C78_1398230 [compost metagenome]